MLLLLPTDTCYGLAGALTHEDYEAIYRAKGRDFAKQLAILVEDFDDMKKYIEISPGQIVFLQGYPHPWSFLGEKKESFALPLWMDHTKYEKISIRVAKACLPNYKWRIGNYPLFLTSANLSGEKESHTLEEAKKYFPSIDGIDGWVCDGKPSDIFSLSDTGEIVYLRRNY
jgi:tRNA A37 threonylcarbamoyladenosine synthetase subunit TsaC/SUA5/YrdC